MRRDVLRLPVNRLGLRIRGSIFEPLIRQVGREMRVRGISLRPQWYLSDGYGCVIDTCNIGLKWVEAIGQIPALARRFRRLLRPSDQVLRTLRHEIGHAFCYVHRLYRRPDFRRLFGVRGDFYGTYPDGVWTPTRETRRRFRSGRYIFVYCLRHPDEDFAVTFQTWLDPASGWEDRFRDRPAVRRKLRCVEEMVRRYGRRPYRTDPTDLDAPISELGFAAGEYLSRERIHRPGGGWYRYRWSGDS